MKTKKLRFIFLALALCFCSLAAAVGFSGVRANVASAADVSYEFSEVYPVGYMLDFSRGVKINVGKNEYDVTDVYVVFPDETAHSGDLVVLTMAGEYEVVFSCKVSGEFVSVRKKFRATGDLISFENGKSTVSYGEMNNNWADAYKNGLKLSLGESDTMIYGRPIDLYKNTITDIITMNVLQRDVVADVGQMVLRLTDVYDPSVYIEIIYKSDPAANVNFLRASANGGSSIGLNTGSAGEGVTVRGQKLVKDRNGTSVAANWYEGKTEEAKKYGPTWNNFTIYLDNTIPEKPLLSVRQTNEYNRTNPAINKMVAEFNNTDLFSYEFGGFTTGEVWLTLSASSFGNGVTSAPIEIGAIAGEFGEDLNISDYEDVTPPTILLDLPEDGVKIYAGCSLKVPVPVVYDASGVIGGAAECVVRYKADSSAPRTISVKAGEFVPDKLGDYSIFYTATDRNGNVAQKRINLYASAVAKDGKLGVDLEYMPAGSHKAGDALTFEGVSAYSLNGEANIEIRVTSPDGTVEKVSRRDDYILRQVGRYKIEYICSDIIYNCVYTDEFDASDAGQYGFDAQKIIMPEYVIKGAKYSFDHVNLVKYTAGGNLAAEYDAYMISDGGSPVKCDPSETQITANNTVKFRLVAKNDASKIIESDELKVVDVNYTVKNNLEFAKYFVGGFDGAKSEGNAYTAFSYSGEGMAAVDFVNPLVTKYFSITFEIPDGTTNYSVTLKLRGYSSRGESVELKLGEDESGSYCEIDGNKTRIDGKLSGAATEVRYYADGTDTFFYVVSSNGIDERIRSAKAVPDTTCLFGMSFDNVNAFNVYQVCNQSFSSINNFDDKTDPYIVAEQAEPVAAYGSKFTTCIPVYGDVLSPSASKKCTLTVYYGEDIYSYGGTEFLNVPADRIYEIAFDKYGDYVFVYTFTDGKGMYATAPFAVNVLDNVAPVITVRGKTEIKAKVGETVKVPEYSVSDNYSGKDEITVSVIVYDERGMLVTAARIDKNNDGSYAFKKAGKYTVYLYCVDAVGNMTYAPYTVTVQ